MDVVRERCRGEGHALEPAVAEQISLEAERGQPLGAERSERLSATTAEGRTTSPQARRQSSARRWPRRRHSPSRVQRAKVACKLVKGMPESQPAMRHCMPPKVSI